MILDLVNKSSTLDLILYVTGVHLLKKFGYTYDLIKEKKYPNVYPLEIYDESLNENDPKYVGYAISTGIQKFIDCFSVQKIDLVLLTGDRIEMLTACIAAATCKIPIAHIHGGDISENAQIDEQIRHAITKFAHIHFCASELSRKRVLQMGEEAWRVYNTGSPEIDLIDKANLLSKHDILKELQLDTLIKDQEKIILCVYHPEIFNAEKSGDQMKELVDALIALQEHVILIYPNNDPGSDLIIKVINQQKGNKLFHIFKNLSRINYLSVMKHAHFMIGNSSSGIIESASFKLPVLNIGIRNANRESPQNILSVDHGIQNIKKGIATITSKIFSDSIKNVKNLYGSGNASEKIVEILQKVDYNENLFRKKFIMI